MDGRDIVLYDQANAGLRPAFGVLVSAVPEIVLLFALNNIKKLTKTL